MTKKRFTVHIRWYNYEKTEGEIELKDNGQPLLISESVEDVRYIQKLLNELHEENQELKRIIKSITEDYNDLKQSNEDARQILKKEFDFATEQRQKHLDDPVVANAYDIIRYDMRRALDKLGGYDD